MAQVINGIGYVAAICVSRWLMDALLDDADASSAATVNLTICFVPFLAYLAINAWCITHHGQSLGKALCGVKVVDMNGNPPGLLRGFVLRAGCQVLFGVIPLVPLVNILCVFRKDRRCLHDHIAGTNVISIW